MRRQYGLGVLQFVLSVQTSLFYQIHFVIAIYLMVILCSHCVEWFGNETVGFGMGL